ncbi:hypothetical protein HDV04_000954, partial [Boothiomyces sp. JEL0838]
MKLNHYKVGKTIGEGSFSKVKIGEHIPSKQKVAIKIINKKFANEKQLERMKLTAAIEQERVRQEEIRIRQGGKDTKSSDLVSQKVKDSTETPTESMEKDVSSFQEVLLLMRFDHPNIVKIFQMIDSEEDVYLVMEYARGGELLDYVISKRVLQENEARKLFRQLVSAVDYIHQSKVVHRDLKLENILLSGNGDILLTDFGLGRIFNEGQKLKTFCGTATYAAPEMVCGKLYDGVKTDIWAMGVVLYVMVTGFLPFQGDNIIELFTNIKDFNCTIPSYLSADLQDLLSNILEPDASKRIDMLSMRYHPWMNDDYNGPPIQYKLKELANFDIKSVITSLSNDGNYTIYNINNFDNDSFEREMSCFESQQRKASSSLTSISLRRRKSISSKPAQSEPIRTLITTGDTSVASSKTTLKNADTRESSMAIAEENSLENDNLAPLTNKFAHKDIKPKVRCISETPNVVLELNQTADMIARGRSSSIAVVSTQLISGRIDPSIAVLQRFSAVGPCDKFDSLDQIELNDIKDWHVAIKIIDKEKMRAMEADKEQLKREIEMERNRIENHPDLQVTENARKQHQKYDYKAIFQEEILLLMRFDHPNVIKTYKVIDTVDEAYIIMEYAPGGELLDYVVSKKYLQETEARKLFRQLVSAMDYIHESGVVHRDLKLENILLNEAGSILVSDFGLGRTFYPEQKLSTFCGTPTHAAPEMVTGQRYNGVKTDIWAMGVVLYVM